MDKTKLKKFAVTLRVELMGLVSSKLEFLLGLDMQNLPVSYRASKADIQTMREKSSTAQGKEDFIEEVAYIWFNRLVALRFMDANGITDTAVITPTQEGANPAIFAKAKEGEIDDTLHLYREKFYDLIDGKIKSNNPENEAYSMLFVAVCNHYASLMPFMFESIVDYTELLLPDDMLSSNSVRAKVVEGMDDESCQNIEIIGWLYQFYISEKKDDVFAMLKKNKKITSSNIPAATQLFTPHWIVKYMVENSLGKLWMLNNPDSTLKEHMRYYIEADEESENFLKLTSPKELTILDPCCGSGHVLTYAFDLLTHIYEEQGYSKSDIPSLILEHNIFGCDIDKRAATLANFALTMKARLYHRRFFNKATNANVVELQEYDDFKNIKNFGSLLTPAHTDEPEDGLLGTANAEYTLQKQILSSEFACVVTNPPYMGSKGMNKELGDFVKKRYPDSKSDLFAVFMERGFEMVKENGYMAMITMQSWMFLSSYEKLRVKLLEKYSITTMIHLDNMVMGIAFGTAATVFQKSKPNKNTQAIYFKIALKDLDENREIKGLK
jgi:SAM-dependent methyltransferase